MTPIAGFLIAVIAGLAVRRGRRAALVVAVPWLIVLVYQSWYIASGRAISPPGTVTDFPPAIGYWLVQAIIVAPALGIAAPARRSPIRHTPARDLLCIRARRGSRDQGRQDVDRPGRYRPGRSRRPPRRR
jgi:hypothetical protein